MDRYLAGVTTLAFEAGLCTGCSMCTRVCPHGVFAMSAGRARVADRDRCMECGACARNCPAGAIRVRAGVGCASGILMGRLGKSGDCCCVVESS